MQSRARLPCGKDGILNLPQGTEAQRFGPAATYHWQVLGDYLTTLPHGSFVTAWNRQAPHYCRSDDLTGLTMWCRPAAVWSGESRKQHSKEGRCDHFNATVTGGVFIRR